MIVENLIETIGIRPLPGEAAFQKMRPKQLGCSLIANQNPDLKSFKEAAVLIAFFQRNNHWYFPIIKKIEDDQPHSGQMALPGGCRNDKETAIQAALRESFEEINLRIEDAQILGTLSPIPIPISQFTVQPVITLLSRESEWKASANEVSEILFISEREILNKKNRQLTQKNYRNSLWEVPFFNIQGREIWGATAMILSELLHLADCW